MAIIEEYKNKFTAADFTKEAAKQWVLNKVEEISNAAGKAMDATTMAQFGVVLENFQPSSGTIDVTSFSEAIEEMLKAFKGPEGGQGGQNPFMQIIDAFKNQYPETSTANFDF
jgi:hypothetical protein